MSVSRVTVSPRADVLAEEYKGQYLWAEIDRLRAALRAIIEECAGGYEDDPVVKIARAALPPSEQPGGETG